MTHTEKREISATGIRWPERGLLLLICCFVAACSLAPDSGRSLRVPPAGCWLERPVVYRMRQSVELEFAGRRQHLQGFLELNVARQKARLVVFNDLGLTLLDLPVAPPGKRSSAAGKSALASPKMEELAAFATSTVQRVYLSLGRADSRQPCQPARPEIEFDRPGGQLIRLSRRRLFSAWQALFRDYRNFAAGRLPAKIVYTNHRPFYRITIKTVAATLKP